MIMPTKHINFSQSLLGFGSYLLTKINHPLSVDDLWHEYQKDLKADNYLATQSFDNLILTLIFLFSINTIKEKNGLIIRCN
jgi:hypothetical protein